MQFSKEILAIATILDKHGYQVFTPELSEKSSSYTELTVEEQALAKREFITNHFKRIEKSDSVLVLNYDKKNIKGYIGSNTLMEIGVAFALGKTIYILNSLGEQGCRGEVLALATFILNGSLQQLLDNSATLSNKQ